MPPFYLRHCNCDWLNHTTWYRKAISVGPHGMLPSCLRWTRLCDWLNHTTLFHSNRALPQLNVASFFYLLHNTDANMLRGLFDDRKYMDILSPYTSGILPSWKTKNWFVFFRINLWPSPSHLVNCTKCSHNPSKDVADWSVVADFKSLLNFNFFLLKIWFSQTSPFVDI